MAKQGRLSESSQRYIQEQALAGKTVSQIVADSGISAPTVRKYWPKQPQEENKGPSEKELRKSLKDSQEWKLLKQEFSSEELKLFEEKFPLLMSQFRSDITATETTQILQCIKYDVFLTRSLSAQKRLLDEIAEIQGELESTPTSNKEGRRELRSRQKVCEEAYTNRQHEHNKLQERSESLMKALKGTRDQRIKNLEATTNKDFLSIVKMLQNKEIAEREGRECGLLALAACKELLRLSQWHTYDDGALDKPVLSPDTIDIGETS